VEVGVGVRVGGGEDAYGHCVLVTAGADCDSGAPFVVNTVGSVLYGSDWMVWNLLLKCQMSIGWCGETWHLTSHAGKQLGNQLTNFSY
jgi:hypothetical protein